jgi:saccharopine dehydrogenase-like NADP-dependent oxidoreductase
VRPLEKVYINYPGKEGSNAYIFGHPEAITFAHHYPEIKASVNLCHGIEESVLILKFIRFLVEWRLISKNQAARVLTWLEGKAFQSAGGEESEKLPSVYGLAFGIKDGQPASVGCTLSSTSSSELSMGEATAYPLACGLEMFLNKEINRAGVFAPESGAIDPSTFLVNFLGVFEEPSDKHSFDSSDLIVLDRSWS